jgi:RNA polymerase sigma factor (sigma-70 family)
MKDFIKSNGLRTEYRTERRMVGQSRKKSNLYFDLQNALSVHFDFALARIKRAKHKGMKLKENNNTRETRRGRIRRVVSNRNGIAPARFQTSDIIQETEIQIWRDGLESLDDEYSDLDQAHLATLAKGHLAKNLRRHQAQKRAVELEQPIDGNDEPSYDRSPSEAIESEEIVSQLLRALNQLPEIEHRILFLRFFGSASFVEIADKLNISRQRLKTLYKNSLRQLQAILSKNQS